MVSKIAKGKIEEKHWLIHEQLKDPTPFARDYITNTLHFWQMDIEPFIYEIYYIDFSYLYKAFKAREVFEVIRNGIKGWGDKNINSENRIERFYKKEE